MGRENRCREINVVEKGRIPVAVERSVEEEYEIHNLFEEGAFYAIL
jgi:hypothetical protein